MNNHYGRKLSVLFLQAKSPAILKLELVNDYCHFKSFQEITAPLRRTLPPPPPIPVRQ